MDEAVKHGESVWFFTAYHILKDASEKAAEKCREGMASEAAEILEKALGEANAAYYDSIDRYVEESPIYRRVSEWLIY